MDSIEDEFELRYADELEVLNERDSEYDTQIMLTPEDIYMSRMSKEKKTQPSLSDDETCDIQKNDEEHTQEVPLSEDLSMFHMIKKTKGQKRTISDDESSDAQEKGTVFKKLKKLDVDLVSSKADVLKKKDHDFKQEIFTRIYRSDVEPLPITRFDGTRVYLNLHESFENHMEMFTFSQKVSSLLSTPIDVLKTEIICRPLKNKSFLNFEKSYLTNEEGIIDQEEIMQTDEKEDTLWVEKYYPKSFIDLLSDEGVNRLLLQWLKLWDKAVFGRERKMKMKTKTVTNPKQFSKFVRELPQDLDEHGRPHHKVAFLSGPPGFGKTTLANVVARHAGYNVVELNASDDRSPEIFRTSLEAATQMKSVLDIDRRPNCLIIDEIDGAPAPSINVLCNFIKSSGSLKGKRKKGDIPLLMRPIICICNDPYVAALKPLRQLAIVLNFPVTPKNRLASRLYEIAQYEELKTDMTALILLCEKTECDIRSCLSTLQFVRNQKKEFSVSDVSGMEIGQKDLHKSLFSVWQEIFYLPKNKMKSTRLIIDEGKSSRTEEEKSLNTRVFKVLKTVQAFGEYEKIFNGIFENYLQIKVKDTHLECLQKSPNWICFADLIQQEIAHHQLFILNPYLPYVAVAFHLLCSSHSYPYLSYPSSHFECISKRNQYLSILTSMTNDVVASIKGFLNVNCLVLDLLPLLLEIVKPNLRPVNTYLYSDREKSELKHVIDIMIAFNLSYRQERSIDGTYQYLLEPNVEELVYFDGSKPKNALLYATKQLIAREIDIEKMRRSDAAELQATLSDANNQNNVVKPQVPTKANASEKLLNQKNLLQPNTDFFGRKIEEAVETSSNETYSEYVHDIWFHFKEGYSNALRRPVFIKDLL